jgi:hypothetical protein
MDDKLTIEAIERSLKDLPNVIAENVKTLAADMVEEIVKHAKEGHACTVASIESNVKYGILGKDEEDKEEEDLSKSAKKIEDLLQQINKTIDDLITEQEK